MWSHDKQFFIALQCSATLFDCPEIGNQQSKIILRIPYEVKISGHFSTITPQISYGKVKVNTIFEDSSTAKKELSENKKYLSNLLRTRRWYDLLKNALRQSYDIDYTVYSNKLPW